MTISMPPPDEAPLVDLLQLAELAADIAPPILAGYLRRAVTDAERAAAALEAAADRPMEVRQLAHRLRGTSATLALARLAQLADAIEHRAGKGDNAADLIQGLRPLIAATRTRIEELAAGV